MTNCVIRQSSNPETSAGSGSLRLVTLQPPLPLPPAVEDLIATGLAEGQAFLDRGAPTWADPGGPYHEPRAIMLLAFDGELAVGIAGVVIDNYARDPTIGRLKHVYVRASHRRRGIAETMVRLCVERAEASFVRLRLRAATPQAGRLYERHGFVHHPGEPDYTHLRDSPPAAASRP